MYHICMHVYVYCHVPCDVHVPIFFEFPCPVVVSVSMSMLHRRKGFLVIDFISVMVDSPL